MPTMFIFCQGPWLNMNPIQGSNVRPHCSEYQTLIISTLSQHLCIGIPSCWYDRSCNTVTLFCISTHTKYQLLPFPSLLFVLDGSTHSGRWHHYLLWLEIPSLLSYWQQPLYPLLCSHLFLQDTTTYLVQQKRFNSMGWKPVAMISQRMLQSEDCS